VKQKQKKKLHFKFMTSISTRAKMEAAFATAEVKAEAAATT